MHIYHGLKIRLKFNTPTVTVNVASLKKIMNQELSDISPNFPFNFIYVSFYLSL